ncbi:hypothetical protein [Pasteurella multocida]|uniref:hypothetical protein n=1 Tax=Pasteurella multocida TaxID=747 RepID=UPI00230172B5|nr:hypothetical protein [Pasteurella multocida]MDA5609352.1 hypothetical protein [Pasteurella multocida subsp. multocida]MDA5616873.1 hypothetical protein [Pasteurella multocida]MDA5626888.1 hypothetical protein [Pasteurella multocida]
MEFTGKKKFKVSTKTFESIEIYAVFEIDFDFPKVKERIIEMSTFWSGSPGSGEPLIEHIQFVLPIATDSVYDIARRIFCVNDIDKNLWNKTEGFAYCEYIGIKLIDFHADEVSADIFEVEEMEE